MGTKKILPIKIRVGNVGYKYLPDFWRRIFLGWYQFIKAYSENTNPPIYIEATKISSLRDWGKPRRGDIFVAPYGMKWNTGIKTIKPVF